MNYRYGLGNLSILIKDSFDLIESLKLIFDESGEQDSYDYQCSINHVSCIEKLDSILIKKVTRTNNKLFVGVYNGKYYTITTHKPIYIITNMTTMRIEVYTEKNIVDLMSIYMFFIMLKKHICRLIFGKGVVPIHGALLRQNITNRGVVIIGESNTGKSSIAYLLTKDGYECLSDDICIFDFKKGLLTGGSNGIYVTEDFIKRYGLDFQKAVCVSPGRKYKIENTPLPASFLLENVSLVLTLGMKDLKNCNDEEILHVVTAAHKNWVVSDQESCRFHKAVDQLIKCAGSRYFINFSQDFTEKINDIANII